MNLLQRCFVLVLDKVVLCCQVPDLRPDPILLLHVTVIYFSLCYVVLLVHMWVILANTTNGVLCGKHLSMLFDGKHLRLIMQMGFVRHHMAALYGLICDLNRLLFLLPGAISQ